MTNMTAGLTHFNYVGAHKVKAMLKNEPFRCDIKNIDINGQKRGCSGFITNTVTGKVCYITTEPFFDGGKGSGLYGDPAKAVMMRTARDTRDYTGGINRWIPLAAIPAMARQLTT